MNEQHNEQVDYASMTDELLIEAARGGDINAEEYLYEKYKYFIRSRARSYFLIGADREDIIQEGMIGFYKAIRDYNPDKMSSFRNFAEICVTRQIITAIKAATRQKHIPLNSYISLNKPVHQEEPERTLMDVLSSARVSDPEEALIGQETYDTMAKNLRESLSPFERETLALYLEGLSYVEIAERLGRQPKAVDNALQRIKHKLEAQLKSQQIK
ncbi:RNA polymerase sporulation sigma factor SigH [Christensenellaceae bacterium OttesenSCG-928-L17]|nr:RNA polymerase sporulation sigma factor SigH [Christensenellaceae bacterium OttesenSCG-928-L17]